MKQYLCRLIAHQFVVLLMEKCVFFCDDDADILDICRMILESEGVKVITCSTAESLYSNLSVHTPHLIFVDNGLTGVTGTDLISFMKKEDAYKTVPIVLFSANAEIEMMAKKANADGYLAKPFDIQELKSAVKSYLN